VGRAFEFIVSPFLDLLKDLMGSGRIVPYHANSNNKIFCPKFRGPSFSSWGTKFGMNVSSFEQLF